MAEKALKKVENQLNCAICLDTYSDPRLLQCFHVYCRKCLIRLAVQDQQGQLSLTCPTCRKVTPIPANGVSGLQSAIHINELLDIRDDLKKARDTAATEEKTESPMPHPTPLKKTTLSCSEHDGRELELYCETCGELICSHCALRGQKHHSHKYDLVSSSLERYKGEMTSSLEPIEKQLEIVNRSLVQLDAERGKISDQQTAIEATIRDTFRHLQDELIGQLNQLTERKLKRLATQKDQIETTQAQLSSYLDFVKESLKTDSHGEVLKMKTTIEKRIKELTSTFQPERLKPITEANIVFTISPDIMSACLSHGEVCSLELSKCHFHGKGLEVAQVGEKSATFLQAFILRGEQYEEPIESLECELVSEMSDTTVRGSVERTRHSLYKISYQPVIKGRHQLHIKSGSQPIRGSPFTVRVKLPIEKLGTPISSIGGLKGPWGVAMNQSGEVVIVETKKCCISVFSPRGMKLRSFSTCGSAHEQFNNPHGMAVDGEGNILVVDGNNHCIQKFTPTGQFLTAVGGRGSGYLQFDIPRDIAFNHKNNKVYVVDQSNRVQVLNSDLTFSSIISVCFGLRSIACDSTTGDVLVTLCDRVQVYSAEWKFLRDIGGGYLSLAAGVAVDTSGMVYVCDYSNHQVFVFTSEGQYVTSFGEKGGIASPLRLTVDDSGVVYVCDIGNNAVWLF